MSQWREKVSAPGKRPPMPHDGFGLYRFEIVGRLCYTILPSQLDIVEGSEGHHSHMYPLINSWGRYNLKTNASWIAHLMHFFANGIDYKGYQLQAALRKRLMDIKTQVAQCNSCEEVLIKTDLFPSKSKYLRELRANANLPSTCH
ncbi:hypothetical protein TTRE_0000969101 [Trichuris trichiura]|uniref:Uncharacterized protein n=1 Tax=Trichuris trichiura TaxID=36087 RepID=A0A077ZQZ1_TRITR|nr:hypothetical protein TTRE_0000969101 [Trichuris trichiura]